MNGLTVFLLALQLLGLPLQIIGLYLCSKRFMRDYMAAKAMQGAITTSGGPWMTRDQACADAVAEMAYQVADAMLKAREA